MSLVSNKEYIWARAEICVVTLSQDGNDVIYPESIVGILQREGACIKKL